MGQKRSSRRIPLRIARALCYGCFCVVCLHSFLYVWRNTQTAGIHAAVFLEATPRDENVDRTSSIAIVSAASHHEDAQHFSRQEAGADQHTMDSSSCRRGSSVTPGNFGAFGDGATDDTIAVVAAFNYGRRCEATVRIGPNGSKFLVTPGAIRVELNNIDVVFDGDLVGPSLEAWNPERQRWPEGSCAYGKVGCDRKNGLSPEYERSRWSLLHIQNSSNVTFRGPGGLRAPGWTFWPTRYKNAEIRAYCLLKLDRSQHIRLSRIALRDSPMYQLVVMRSRAVDLNALTINIQADKVKFGKDVGKWGPDNTDGVNILDSQDVHLRDSVILSGDDNIVIKAGSRNILVQDITLRHGKGLSIGSLGELASDSESVSNVCVRSVKINHCRHGVRIKTWSGGSGFIQNASFESFRLKGVKFGILIDQNYCPRTQRPQGCAKDNAAAVRIEDVRFQAFSGSHYFKDRQVDCRRCSRLTFTDINVKKT